MSKFSNIIFHIIDYTQASKSSAYPQYKCLSALLSDLTSRLSGFLEAQAYYLALTTAGRKRPPPPAVFAFDGEFSVVSLDFDILRRKEDVNRGTLKLKEDIEKLGGVRFRCVTLLTSPRKLLNPDFMSARRTGSP